MQRLNKGAGLRSAMAAAGLDIPHLVEATRAVDPAGQGVSRAAIGFLVSRGKSARETTSDRAAALLAEALDVPLGDLFVIEESALSAVGESTSTPGVQNPMDAPPLPDPLLTSAQLRTFLQKSASWLEKEIATDPEFPVHWIGRSRRFDTAEVLAHMATRRRAHLAALAATG
jgi:hypothetical protein